MDGASRSVPRDARAAGSPMLPGLPLDLLYLHPTGTTDPQRVSLALGLLELMRKSLETAGIRSLLWAETASDPDGHARFLLRAEARPADELARKRRIVLNALHLVSFDFAGGAGAEAHIEILGGVPASGSGEVAGRATPQSVRHSMPFDVQGIYDSAPALLNRFLSVLGRDEAAVTPAALFRASDPSTAAGVLLSLERVVAVNAGVGFEAPERLFEPVLLFLSGQADHPIATDCLLRIVGVALRHKEQRVRDAACDALARWAEIASRSAQAPYYLALARLQAGDAEPARLALEESLRRDAVFLPAVEQYAGWFAQRGFTDKALEVLQSALGRGPYDGNLLDQAGCILANAGRIEEAQPLFRSAAERGGPPSAMCNLARSLLSLGREAEALAALEESIARGKMTADALDLLAMISRGEGEAAARARAILRGRLLEQGNDDTEEITVRAIELVSELDGPQAAEPAADRLLAATAIPEVRRRLHLALLRGARPGFDEEWNGAVRAAYEGDAQEAVTFFSAIVAERAGFGAAHFFLAVALDRLGQIPETTTHIEAAFAAEPQDPLVLDLLARARAAAGRTEDAARIHHAAAVIASADPRILRNAAVSLLRAGYAAEGNAFARTSLSLEPKQPDLLEILRAFSAQDRQRQRGLMGRLGGVARTLLGADRSKRP